MIHFYGINIKRITIFLIAAIFVFACKKEENGGLELLATDSMWSVSALDGWGDVIALSHEENDYSENIKIYQHSGVDNNRLINISSVFSGVRTLYHRVTDIVVDSSNIIVVQNHNIYEIGWVSIIKVNSSESYKLDGIYTFPYTVDKSALFKNILLTVSENIVYLYDVSGSSEPRLMKSFISTPEIGKIFQYPKGFYFLNSNGFSIINCTDTSNIMLNEKADQYLRNCIKGSKYGDNLYLSGPSKFAGCSKIVKVNISNPESPVILCYKDDISEDFINFTYDRSGNYFLFTNKRIFKYVENNSSFMLKGFDMYNDYYRNWFYSIDKRIYAANSQGVNLYGFK